MSISAYEGWPLVSVIVVNYNGGELVIDCLESLLADSYPHRELLLVDNASTDQSLSTVSELAARSPEIKIIRSDRNLGYAGGVNLALKLVSGEYIAILNMDVVAERDWLKPLIAFLQQNKKVGAVNPLITVANGCRVNAAGLDVHISGLGFNRWLGRRVNGITETPIRVSGIQGSAFVTRRVLLERVAGIDASGFLYHEDVSLSWLLRMMGFEFYCVPQSVMRHDYFLSMYPLKLYLLERNRWAMLLAHLHKATFLYLAPMLILTELLMWAYCILRGWSFMRAKLRSYGWVLDHRKQIEERQRLVESVRTISDWQVLRKLRWSYVLDQLLVLGRERGHSKRQNVDALPEDEKTLPGESV